MRSPTPGSRGDVPDEFRIIAEAIGAESCSPGFRGCPFINAAAEYADPEHAVRRVVDAHRRWFRHTVQDLLDEISVPDSARVADQLVMLRDGAMVSGYLSDPSTVADALYNAGRAVMAFHPRHEGQHEAKPPDRLTLAPAADATAEPSTRSGRGEHGRRV